MSNPYMMPQSFEPGMMPMPAQPFRPQSAPQFSQAPNPYAQPQAMPAPRSNPRPAPRVNRPAPVDRTPPEAAEAPARPQEPTFVKIGIPEPEMIGVMLGGTAHLVPMSTNRQAIVVPEPEEIGIRIDEK